jgi:hypothetical protein
VLLTRRARLGTAAVAAALVWAATVHSAKSSLDQTASATSRRATDLAVIRLRVDRPDARVVRALAADFDDDGDVDVVVSSVDQGATIWINDGTGHFVGHHPNSGAAMATSGHGVDESSKGESSSTASPAQDGWHALETRCRFVVPSLTVSSCLPPPLHVVPDQLVADTATRGPPENRSTF